MNTSTVTDTITDLATDLAHRIPSRSDAVSTISSTFDDVTDRLPNRLPDVELPDLSKSARRTRRAVARVVPGMSTSRLDTVRSRASSRWIVISALVVATVAAIVVLRRRARSHEPATRRDDWMTTPSGDSRPADDHRREPAGARS